MLNELGDGDQITSIRCDIAIIEGAMISAKGTIKESN
jgi:hypothetical protein